MQTQTPEITVDWRPGCPFCARLGRQLDLMGVTTRWINIWSDPQAAALVRSVAQGNETVPTVVIARQAMVNPDINTVKAALQQATPGAASGDIRRRRIARHRLLFSGCVVRYSSRPGRPDLSAHPAGPRAG